MAGGGGWVGRGVGVGGGLNGSGHSIPSAGAEVVKSFTNKRHFAIGGLASENRTCDQVKAPQMDNPVFS